MGVIRVLVLLAASATALVPHRRLPPWVFTVVLAGVAVGIGVVPLRTAGDAARDLAPALAFLAVAVPLAVLLDRTGFFAAVAAMFDGGRHLYLALWLLAAATTIVFNLDAAVVLLTPLYVRIAVRRGLDPVGYGLIPALLASLASSVLPVSNLTNLIAVGRIDVTVGTFVGELALPSVLAVAAGGVLHRRRIATGASVVVDEPVDRRALRVGIPVVIWLVAGFTIGHRLSIAPWAVALVALVGLMVHQRAVPWRTIPVGAIGVAAGLGVVAAGAAPHIPVDELLAVDGVRGEAATLVTFALGSNVVNNLPALLLTLPSLEVHPDRLWAVLLGVNLGPTLWVTGALSTLLWQATMARLGHPVTARTYARAGVAVGVPALVLAVLARAVVVGLGG